MNYTKNYHLPQWVEDDRILRTDFNQMCANIDDAIAKAAQGGTQNSSQAWDGLLRLARQSLAGRWAAFDQNSLYAADGLLYNPLSSSALAASLSGVTWKSGSGICAGRGEALSQTILRDSCIDCWPGNSGVSPDDSRANSVYRFTAPVNGVIKGCAFFLYTNFTSTQSSLSMTVTFTTEKRASNGEFSEIYRKLFLIERSGTETKRFEIPLELDFPIEKGSEYRLKIAVAHSTTWSPVPGRFGFLVDYVSETNTAQGYNDHSKFTVETSPVTSGSHTRRFNAEGAASHGLVMLHYRKNVQSSGLTPTLGGKQMTLLSEAQRTDSGGAYYEAWYACEGSFSGSTELRVSFKTGGSDELCLVRYAALVM